MSTFEDQSHRIIDQSDFVEIADGLLQQAHDPEKGIQECMVAAQSLVQGLDDIKAGNLEVKPPLSEEQIANYRKDSSLIISLGEKSMAALAQSEKRGITGRKRGKESSSKPTFAGHGSDPKK